MKKVLVVVDMQNDFINGSLGSKEARECVGSVVELINDPSFDEILVTLDTHDETYLTSQEGKNLPIVHCVKGTAGWNLHPAVEEALIGRKAVRFEKNAFGSLDLARYLAKHQPDEIVMCGVCTDICLISNAMLIKAEIPEVPLAVVAEACAATTPQKQIETLHVMESCQVAIR